MATMTYRALDVTGDFTFGAGPQQGFLNGTEAVAQAVKTRLLLLYGDWFLDLTDGLQLWQKILGTSGANKKIVDTLIQERILNTLNVDSIISFTAQLQPATRQYTFSCQILTAFTTTIVITNA